MAPNGQHTQVINFNLVRGICGSLQQINLPQSAVKALADRVSSDGERSLKTLFLFAATFLRSVRSVLDRFARSLLSVAVRSLSGPTTRKEPLDWVAASSRVQ
jgi:hypothetical protein